MNEQKQSMESIEKALQDIAKAVECIEAVASIKITFTFKKPKSSKATKESK